MNGGNYSASESYSQACDRFRRHQIDAKKIRRRWFRNFYVLYQSKGFFTHNTWVMEAGKFDPSEFSGTYYGPFFKEYATEFAKNVRLTHENFIMGG
jgi:hypothetical protein